MWCGQHHNRDLARSNDPYSQGKTPPLTPEEFFHLLSSHKVSRARRFYHGLNVSVSLLFVRIKVEFPFVVILATRKPKVGE